MNASWLSLALSVVVAQGVSAAKPKWVCLPGGKGAGWDCRQGGADRTSKPFVAPVKRPLVRQPYTAPAFSPQRPSRLAPLRPSPWLEVFLPDPGQLAARDARHGITRAHITSPRDVQRDRPNHAPQTQGKTVTAQRGNSAPPVAYYIQLSAASSRRALARFARLHRLDRKQLFVVATRRNDAPWFQLLSAAFAARSKANSALADLPDSLKRSGPWVRKLRAQDIEPASRVLP